MSFPLLRLPLVASINAINNIDVGDFVNLIRTSTKMRNLVKYSRVPIDLTIYSNSGIAFNKLSDPSKTKQVPFFVKRLSIGDQGNIPFKPFVRQRMECMWETDLEGYRRMMDDFVDIFNVKSANVDLSVLSIQYLEYAMKLGLKFTEARVSLGGEQLDEGRKVLSACAHASELYVSSGCCPGSFRFDGFHEYAMDYFELRMDNRFEWLTLDHLCALVNCSSVKIVNMKLSGEGLNQFLKHWIAGTGRMKTLVVHLECAYDEWYKESINPETVLNGIARKKLLSRYGDKYEVERSDGYTAYVTCRGLTFTIGDFEMAY